MLPSVVTQAMMVPAGWTDFPRLEQPFARPNRRAAFTFAENSLANGPLVGIVTSGGSFVGQSQFDTYWSFPILNNAVQSLHNLAEKVPPRA